MQMATHARWTVAELERLPDDGNRYEIIDGELFVTPAPSKRHQRAVVLLVGELLRYLGPDHAMEVVVAPFDVRYADDTLVQPDVLVTPRSPANIAEHLLLAIEVLSPGTARRDRQVKRPLYQRQGTAEYWIVDLDARLIERWRPTSSRPEILDAEIRWSPDSATEPLVVDLTDFFAQIWRE